MTKREMIDRIQKLNTTAQPEFLAEFSEDDLLAYLHQLNELKHDGQMEQMLEPVLQS